MKFTTNFSLLICYNCLTTNFLIFFSYGNGQSMLFEAFEQLLDSIGLTQFKVNSTHRYRTDQTTSKWVNKLLFSCYAIFHDEQETWARDCYQMMLNYCSVAHNNIYRHVTVQRNNTSPATRDKQTSLKDKVSDASFRGTATSRNFMCHCFGRKTSKLVNAGQINQTKLNSKAEDHVFVSQYAKESHLIAAKMVVLHFSFPSP